MLRHLILARWRSLVNALRHSRHSVERVVLFVVLGLVFAAGIFAASHWFFARCLEIEPIGELVVQRALGMSLMVIFSLLCFSNLVNAFSTLYLAEDLSLLVSRPVSLETLYTARFMDTSALSFWMIGPFSLPIFLSAGLLFDAGASFYLTLTSVYLALAVIPTALGVAVSLILTSMLSAKRARHLLIAAGSIAAGVGFFVLRSMQPERLMHPDQRASLLEVLQGIRGSDMPWMPSTWALDALWPELARHVGTSHTHPVTLLMSAACASFFIGGWLFRGLYRRAYSRAQEGLHRSTLGRVKFGGAALRLARGRGDRVISLPDALRRKDALVFIRDSSQWSQLLLLAAVVAVYVLNFKYIRAVTGTGLLSDMGLHFINLALTGFVCLALIARFVFPAVSLEGPAIWMVKSSPNPMSTILHAKARSWTLPMVLFANLLMVTTHAFVHTTAVFQLLSLIVVSPLVAGLVKLGIGLGARYPRFRVANAAEIATGLGGILFMLSGAAILVTVVVASIPPTAVIVHWLDRGHLPHHADTVVFAVIGALLSLTLPLLVGSATMRSGARHLEAEDG